MQWFKFGLMEWIHNCSFFLLIFFAMSSQKLFFSCLGCTRGLRRWKGSQGGHHAIFQRRTKQKLRCNVSETKQRKSPKIKSVLKYSNSDQKQKNYFSPSYWLVAGDYSLQCNDRKVFAAEVVDFLSSRIKQSHHAGTESWKIWKGLIAKTLLYMSCLFRFFMLRRLKVVLSVSCFYTDVVSRCCFDV